MITVQPNSDELVCMYYCSSISKSCSVTYIAGYMSSGADPLFTISGSDLDSALDHVCIWLLVNSKVII